METAVHSAKLEFAVAFFVNRNVATIAQVYILLISLFHPYDIPSTLEQIAFIGHIAPTYTALYDTAPRTAIISIKTRPCLARMKTSCFYLYSGEGRISIARTSPKHVLGGLKYYPALAPGKWLFDAAYKDYTTYREHYFREILAPLNPQKVWDDLHALAGNHEPVLLCHEHYPDHKPDDWCHRRMVAEWFEQALGIEVPEMELPQHNALKAQASLF